MIWIVVNQIESKQSNCLPNRPLAIVIVVVEFLAGFGFSMPNFNWQCNTSVKSIEETSFHCTTALGNGYDQEKVRWWGGRPSCWQGNVWVPLFPHMVSRGETYQIQENQQDSPSCWWGCVVQVQFLQLHCCWLREDWRGCCCHVEPDEWASPESREACQPPPEVKLLSRAGPWVNSDSSFVFQFLAVWGCWQPEAFTTFAQCLPCCHSSSTSVRRNLAHWCRIPVRCPPCHTTNIE